MKTKVKKLGDNGAKGIFVKDERKYYAMLKEVAIDIVGGMNK